MAWKRLRRSLFSFRGVFSFYVLVFLSPFIPQLFTNSIFTTLPPPQSSWSNVSSVSVPSSTVSTSLLSGLSLFERIRLKLKLYDPSGSNSNFKSDCKRDLEHAWPILEPGTKSLVLGFLMTMAGNLDERLGLKIPGMMSYAVETVNKHQVLPDGYKLQMKVRDTLGEEVVSTGYVADLDCSNISAIIGPESTCWVESTLAESKNLPMISYACADENASKRKTFARTNPSEIHKLRATIETLIHFNWRKFSIVYKEDGFSSQLATLSQLAKERNLTVNHKLAFDMEEELPNIFLRTKQETRIYVLISHRTYVPRALLAMTLSGLLKAKDPKEYFLIYVDSEEFKQEGWMDYIFKPMTVDKMSGEGKCMHQDLQAYEGGLMVITNTIPKESTIRNIENNTREYNKKLPFCFHTDVNKSLMRKTDGRKFLDTETHVPFLPASHLYDAVYQYAEAVRRIYNDRVTLLKERNIDPDSPEGAALLDVSAIGRNGTAIAKQLSNHTFTSILGYEVLMGPDRESEGAYSIYYFKEDDECSKPQYQTKLNCSSHCLIKISEFKNNTLNITVQISIKDEPDCGYKNECQYEKTDVRMVAMIVLSVTVVLVAFYSMIKYRHWKYEQEISGLQWRINKSDLTPYSGTESIKDSRVRWSV